MAIETLEQYRRRRARTAVQRFNQMRPILEAKARRISGNPKLKVVAGGNTQTDGDTIWIKPPLAMARRERHNKGLCGLKEWDIALCPACRLNDDVMGLLAHELGHICFGTFDRYNTGEMEAAVLARPWLARDVDYKYSNRFTRQLMDDNESSEFTFRPTITRASVMKHPWVTFAVLVMEDARCDHMRLLIDPTEAARWDEWSDQLLEMGVENSDGTRSYYIDMPVENQALMAFLFACRDAYIDDYFDEQVVAAVHTDACKELMQRAINSPDVLESFRIALDTVEYFAEQEVIDLDPKGTPEEIDEMLKELMKWLAATIGHGEDPCEGQAPGTMPGGGGGEEEGEGDGEEGDGKSTVSGWSQNKDENQISEHGLDPAAVKAASESLDILGRVPVNIGKPTIFHKPDANDERQIGWTYLHNEYKQGELRRFDMGTNAEFKSPERLITPALTAARLAFGVNNRVEYHRNQRSGRIHGNSLGKRVPFGDDRLFGKRTVPDKRDYHVVIGMDISGSTGGSTLAAEKKAVLAMCTVLARLGISFEVWAHTTIEYGDDPWVSYSAGDYGPAFYCIKPAGVKWNDEYKDRLRGLIASSGNLDGHSLLFYRRQLEKSRATDKVLMYYTDGAMPASNYDEELEVLQSEIKYCQSHHMTLMAVGMGVDTPKEHGFDTVEVDNSDPNYRVVVDHLAKRLMR